MFDVMYSPSYVGDFIQVESWFNGETPIRKTDKDGTPSCKDEKD